MDRVRPNWFAVPKGATVTGKHESPSPNRGALGGRASQPAPGAANHDVHTPQTGYTLFEKAQAGKVAQAAQAPPPFFRGGVLQSAGDAMVWKKATSNDTAPPPAPHRRPHPLHPNPPTQAFSPQAPVCRTSRKVFLPFLVFMCISKSTQWHTFGRATHRGDIFFFTPGARRPLNLYFTPLPAGTPEAP